MNKLSDYSISALVWENNHGCPNDIIVNDTLPYMKWHKVKITHIVNVQFSLQFRNKGHHTYFMMIYDKDDELIKTLCTSMDEEEDLESLFEFLRLI